MPVFGIGDILLYFFVPALVPGLEFCVIDVVDALLHEVGLVEAEWIQVYSFCLDMWCYIYRRLRS